MDLVRKVRLLIGALAHAPFTPRPEKEDNSPQDSRERGSTPVSPDRTALSEPDVAAAETERVADLIARQRSENNR